MAEPTRVAASLTNCRWGAFDASFPPVASIDPGELVILECLSGGPEVMPPQEKMMAVHPALREVHAKLPRLGAHIITGPVEVRGAEPGDALRIDIEKIEDTCRLVLTHDDLPRGASPQLYGGWPKVLSGLKTLLETGDILTTPGSLR